MALWHRKHDLLLAPVTPTAAPPVETLYNSDAFRAGSKARPTPCPSTSPAAGLADRRECC
jgi:aspartyl-tRNA(Asn)/glutamyl-tRNA(Gln) amidotransferase subunit A